jgi:DNA-binding MarR family transcriptional regulator
MLTTTDQGLERFQRAMAGLFRHGTLQRLHDHVASRAGIECERAGFLVMRRVVSEGPIRVTDLARDLGLDPSTISRHLVTATKSGERVVALLETERRRVLATVLAGWDQTDRDALFDLTERFAADLSDHVQHHLT